MNAMTCFWNSRECLTGTPIKRFSLIFYNVGNLYIEEPFEFSYKEISHK